MPKKKEQKSHSFKNLSKLQKSILKTIYYFNGRIKTQTLKNRYKNYNAYNRALQSLLRRGLISKIKGEKYAKQVELTEEGIKYVEEHLLSNLAVYTGSKVAIKRIIEDLLRKTTKYVLKKGDTIDEKYRSLSFDGASIILHIETLERMKDHLKGVKSKVITIEIKGNRFVITAPNYEFVYHEDYELGQKKKKEWEKRHKMKWERDHYKDLYDSLFEENLKLRSKIPLEERHKMMYPKKPKKEEEPYEITDEDWKV
jgi:DNA-binding MarR family transcriptional regulator